MVSRKERVRKIMKVKRKIKTNGRNKDTDGKTLIHKLNTMQRKVKKNVSNLKGKEGKKMKGKEKIKEWRRDKDIDGEALIHTREHAEE